MINKKDVKIIKKHLKIMYPKYKIQQISISFTSTIIYTEYDLCGGFISTSQIDLNDAFQFQSLDKTNYMIKIGVDNHKRKVFWNFQFLYNE